MCIRRADPHIRLISRPLLPERTCYNHQIQNIDNTITIHIWGIFSEPIGNNNQVQNIHNAVGNSSASRTACRKFGSGIHSSCADVTPPAMPKITETHNTHLQNCFILTISHLNINPQMPKYHLMYTRQLLHLE